MFSFQQNIHFYAQITHSYKSVEKASSIILHQLFANIHGKTRSVNINAPKNEWTPLIFHNIMWKTHGNSLQQFTGWIRKTLIHFVHNWLPCNTSHSLQLLGKGRLYPVCNVHKETQSHFLCCKHPNMQSKWETAASNISKHLLLYNKEIHQQVLRMINDAITK
jgi:hypothetical protein